jgi:hypothetical protein
LLFIIKIQEVIKALNILVSLIFLVSFDGIQTGNHCCQGKSGSMVVFREAGNCCAGMETYKPDDMHSFCRFHQNKEESSCKGKTGTVKLITMFETGKKEEVTGLPVFYIHKNFCLSVKHQKELLNSGTLIFDVLPPPLKPPADSELGLFLC